MNKRKLPSVGNTVAYTRDALHGSSARADWRGVIVRPCDYATSDWPMVTVLWHRGEAKGCESDINAGNLCTTKSVAFVESAAPVHGLIS